MRRIEPEASKSGICKITVPPLYRDRVGDFPERLKNLIFTAREQKLKEHLWENFGKTEIIYEHRQYEPNHCAFNADPFLDLSRCNNFAKRFETMQKSS